jgi:hypothetical protein
MSVKVKLTALYSFVLLLILALFGFVSYYFLSYGSFRSLDVSLAAEADRTKDAISQNGSGTLEGSITAIIKSANDLIYIYDIDTGAIIGSSTFQSGIKATLADAFKPGIAAYSLGGSSSDGQLRLRTIPFEVENAPAKLLVVARDASYIQRTLNSYRDILFASIPFALVIAAVSGYFLAYRSMRQVKVITATANGIDPADLTARIPVKVNDELGRLSTTLNSLFDRIHGFISRQHRFTSDASHDLKAPLTVIKAEADLALMKSRQPEEYQEALKTVVGQVGKMRFIIDDLLTLASLDAGPRPANSLTFDLGASLGRATDQWETAAAAKGVTLTREIQPGIEIYGEPEQFERLFDNLLSNAVKFTPPGGAIAVSLAEESGNIIITVKDTGIGMAPEHLSEIFERFYRVDRSVEGTGLGLSIIRGTAEIYRGRVEVESGVGKGSTFQVILPRKHKT